MYVKEYIWNFKFIENMSEKINYNCKHGLFEIFYSYQNSLLNNSKSVCTLN